MSVPNMLAYLRAFGNYSMLETDPVIPAAAPCPCPPFSPCRCPLARLLQDLEVTDGDDA